MQIRLFKRSAKRGFTLVELLIVVAIIGVLSTIGVPTFKRMIQKSKKSEARVNLGGIYTAETGFFAEYSTYGNHLNKMGFEMDGGTGIYTLGFYTGTNCAAATTPVPANAAPFNTAFPSYHTGTINIKTGNVTASTCAYPTTAGSIAAAAGSFTAGASGAIAPGASASGDMDGWTINNTRTLTNYQDGVK